MEKALEILESNPLGAYNAFHRVKILEGQGRAVHRDIAENKNINHREEQQKV